MVRGWSFPKIQHIYGFQPLGKIGPLFQLMGGDRPIALNALGRLDVRKTWMSGDLDVRNLDVRNLDVRDLDVRVPTMWGAL